MFHSLNQQVLFTVDFSGFYTCVSGKLVQGVEHTFILKYPHFPVFDQKLRCIHLCLNDVQLQKERAPIA